MNAKRRLLYTIIVSLLLLGAVTVVVAASAATPAPAETRVPGSVSLEERPAGRVYAPASAAYTYTTVITVNSTVDTPGDGNYVTCDGWSPCNLRRALVDARSRSAGERPILIRFDLPLTDTNYQRGGVTGTWTIVMEADYTYGLDTSSILEHESRIIIDGDTQPGGRSDGPKIIINSEYSLEALKEDNIIRNLAFNGGGGVYLNESSNVGGGNLVENVWIGLHGNGQEIVPGDNPDVTLAGTGFIIASDNNVISGCLVTGPHIAVSLQGDSNTIQYSYFGVRSDKTVPTDTFSCLASSVYNPARWYGGGSIKFLSGSNNQVISNTIAATHLPHSDTETYPPAIETGGADNLFAYNTIGIDGDGNEVGVCGQGFHVTGQNIHVLSNTIANSRYSYTDASTGDPTEGAIYVNDSSPLARQFTIRNNIVRDSTSLVIEYGSSIPEALRLFDPPRIVSISGTLVVGETEPGSDCPNCLVELYLDDLDDGQDALELLKIGVIDNVTGTARFTVTLDSPLPADHGLRVLATTQDDYVISDYLSGTTVKMSPAYAPDATFIRDLAPGWNLFSIDVTPPDAAITQVLSSLAGQYDLVLAFDGGPSGGGRTYDPANPGASDLTTIDVLHGYWIHITAATTQTLTLDYEPVRDDTDIQLYEGWNLVSYLPDRTLAVTEALESISGQYDMVRGFDGTAQTYIPGQPTFSDLDVLEPGYAYWIKVSDGAGAPVLNYSGADTPVMRPTGMDGPPAATGGSVTSADFFTPTTEWVDFYGVASLSGFSAPRNASVVAYDPDGVVAGAFTVHTPPYYGFLHVYVDDPNTPGDEGIESGDEVRFTINSRLATPSKPTVWNSDFDAKEVNLEVTMPYVATDEWADFWGTLTLDGAPAPVGTIVAAYDADGVYCGDFIIAEAGQYGFLHAYGDDSTTTTTDEGAVSGDSISFKAFLPLSLTPISLTIDSGDPTWNGRGSRTEINLSGTSGPVAPNGVVISGPTVGEPGTAYTFTITVNPVEVATPLTYTIWRTDASSPLVAGGLGRIVNYHDVTWDTTGTKIITVTATNEAGSITGTHTIEITAGGVISITSVTINGPTAGDVDTTYTFTAAVQPDNATTPITYTWSPEPDSGQGSAHAGYRWSVAGTQRITVTAANAGGSAQDTHDITISAGTTPGAPTGVTITGPDRGRTTNSYIFTVTVEPVSVTLPITYALDYTDKDGPPTVMSVSLREITLPSHTWDTPGLKTITMTASNVAGTVVGTHTILIAKVFGAGPSGKTMIFTDTVGLRTIIEIPAGALSGTTIFVYTPTLALGHPLTSGLRFAGHGFDLDASTQISGQITVTVEYRDQDWMDAGIADESTLRLYYWNTAISDWDDVANACGPPIPTYAPDTVNNVLTAPVCHLSEFAMLGESSGGHTVYLPLVLRDN